VSPTRPAVQLHQALDALLAIRQRVISEMRLERSEPCHDTLAEIDDIARRAFHSR
jgi:hypothetical protein